MPLKRTGIGMKDSSAINILVVDDDESTRGLLSEVLTEEGFRVVTSGSGEEALDIGSRESFAVIISDMRLGPNLNGLDVLRAYKAIQPESEVILITAFGSMETAIEAVKAGAFDYLSKPFKLEEVVLLVGRALENRSLIAENRNLKRQLGAQGQMSTLVGRTPAMLEIYKKIAMIADLRSAVLITGESGTGKELVAKALHYNSRRSKEPFVAVNCGALTESLLETELFGHVRGSFTGAFENKRGILEEASGGAVFLDEVSEMSRGLQVKLLRAIEAQEVRRVGGSKAVHIDVRFIAATNRPLDELVRQKRFREDLYYRLKVVEIDLPPLRDRSEDIPLLIEHFLKRVSEDRGQAHAVSSEALGTLVSYGWPGNVRELENALESAAAVNRTGLLTPEDLPPKVLRVAAGNGQRADDLYADLPSLEELKKRYVTYVLRLSNANKAKASDILGVSRRTLYNILEKFKLPC
ncbi:MAG TPA: sigma-54 dependent transcriptional regulator [Terriglobia bacterium]|nr:sigma-54 dependent transcriptional regulator [Terriglobia bacterium]